ncbi:MAG TPA: VOC family protein [Acidimicrobiales bacterium]|nr:VOC family protein [Acidimicrobiales bacterium]
MEQWLGPIDQLGYVVDDIEGSMAHWTRQLGVGPFYFLPSPPMQELTYRGRPTPARIAVALSFSGLLQVELIQPLDDEPTPYRDFMAAHGTGLHHVARFVDDYDEAVARYAARGMEAYFGGRGLTEKQRFCYFDTEFHGGTASELIETVEFGGFFEAIRAAAADWDGSDPVRTVGG